MSEGLRRTLLFRMIFWKLGIRLDGPPEEADRKLDAVFRTQVDNAPSCERFVVLALDAVYDARGERDERRTRYVVANDFVLARSAADPRLVPAVSIHPWRKDALDELDRCRALGARLVKWIPNTQGFPPDDPAVLPFYRKAAALGIPLLVHTGPEYSLGSISQRFGDPETLRPALDAGVTVIAAHGGGPEWRNLGRPWRPFLAMLRSYPNLYADTSAMCLLTRRRWLLKYLREEGAAEKLVHGSDCPIPVSPWVFLDRLGPALTLAIAREKSWIERDIRIKRALGMPEAVFHRGAELLGIVAPAQAAGQTSMRSNARSARQSGR